MGTYYDFIVGNSRKEISRKMLFFIFIVEISDMFMFYGSGSETVIFHYGYRNQSV